MVGAPGRRAGPDPEFVARVLSPCAICGRDNRGLGWSKDHRHFRYCGPACMTKHERSGFQMIDKTERERAAIKAARRPFAEALTELGLMPHFENRTAEEIDQLIEAAVTGFTEGLRASDPPF